MQHKSTLNDYLRQAMADNGAFPALGNFRDKSYTYADTACMVAGLHVFFRKMGVKPGDRLAMCAKNSANWAVTAIAGLCYGAVVVPILHEFRPDMVEHLVNHCGATMLFADNNIYSQLNVANIPTVKAVIFADGFGAAAPDGNPEPGKIMPDGPVALAQTEFGKDAGVQNISFATVSPDDIMLINYTSGSTGMSKGVMLSERALWSNLQFCIDGLTFLTPGDTMLSMLPLAHMYGFMVEMIHPFAKGCSITFLNRTPSPRVILEAFAVVRPKMIVTVPLVVEKIIRTRVFPQLQKPAVRILLAIPGVRNIVLGRVRKQLIKAFGGQLLELILGGAALNDDVAQFLAKIKFPVTVGYGMTECAPLISYCPWREQRPGSCGRVVDRMSARIDSPDAANVPGVLWVKGDNVMSGYYHNDEATQQAFDKDGWMNTGDICVLDNDGYLYIRGRDKNLILGPSGQNIYPEEIEQKLANMPLVLECLVVDAGHAKLEALIVPDREAAEKQNLSDDDIAKQLNENVRMLNASLPAYERIASLRVMDGEFEKTPKRSIKRYLYTK